MKYMDERTRTNESWKNQRLKKLRQQTRERANQPLTQMLELELA